MGYGIRMIEATPEMRKSGEDYYCIQIWSMAFYRNLMSPVMEWNTVVIEPLCEEGIPKDVFDLSWPERLSHPSEEVREHFRKSWEELSKRATDPRLVAGVKFGDPGGIMVSEECRLIVEHLDGLNSKAYRYAIFERVKAWREYCRVAIDYGGFEVS